MKTPLIDQINRGLEARRHRMAGLDGSLLNAAGFRFGFLIGVATGSAGVLIILLVYLWLSLP